MGVRDAVKYAQGNLSKAVSAWGSVGFEAGAHNYRSAKAQVGVMYSW
jgi:hypothetical protein